MALVSIGHWPSYSNPDPKDLGFAFLIPFVYLLLCAAALSVFIYPLLAFVMEGKRSFRKLHFWIFAAGLLIWILDFTVLHFINPRQDGLLSWLLD